MIIDCISDLHGHHPELEGGDLLIVAGDLTARGTLKQYEEFFQWMLIQKYKKKIFIAGNHDMALYRNEVEIPDDDDIVYLCDSDTEFDGLKIYGSPWSLRFEGMNPRFTAFTEKKELDLWYRWNQIPDDTDVVITHSPPYDILDETDSEICVGSDTLGDRIFKVCPKIHVFGHIHEAYGLSCLDGTTYINASHCDENYNPVNKPIRVIL